MTRVERRPSALLLPLVALVPVLVALATFGALTGGPPAANAATPASAAVAGSSDPPVFRGERVIDEVGALGDRADEVRDAIRRLATDHNIDLWVVFVDGFGASGRDAWVREAVSRNGLGSDDALLAVATVDRQYGFRSLDGFPVGAAAMLNIQRVAVEPRLREGDWAGAAIGAATGIGQAAAAATVTADSGGSGVSPWVIAFILLLAGGALLFFLLQRNRIKVQQPAVRPAGSTAAEPTDPHAGVSTEELARTAAGRLVALDDALTTSAFDVDRAASEFGEGAARPFREALADARHELEAGYTLQARITTETLDDTSRRALAGQILTHCDSAASRLAEPTEQFEALRDRAGRAPALLDTLAHELDAFEARLHAGAASLAALRERHPAADISTVETNVDQATDRVAFARRTVDDGRAAIAAGDHNRAALDTSGAEEAIATAAGLLDALDRALAGLDSAAAALDATLADLRRDLAEAEAVVAATPAAAGPAAAARQVLTETEAARATGPIDAAATLARVHEVSVRLATALAAGRDQARAESEARRLLGTALATAEARVAAAADFITGRRGAVGAPARTRLAEAQRILESARTDAVGDPVTALDAAQSAARAADEAVAAAQQDVERFRGSYTPARSGFGIDDLILGGILISAGTGHHSHDGWGGFTTGGFGGGFSGGGSFGGGSTGGGGFSGGGSF